MEIARSEVSIESRLRSIKLSSLKAQVATGFTIRVAGVGVRISFDPAWTSETVELCRAYWAQFICSEPKHEVEVILSPAEGEFLRQDNPMWNDPNPFQIKVEDRTGAWILHRDFTCLVRGTVYQAWLPKPTEIFTDALDNILAVSVRVEAEKRAGFLFHCAIVEHEAKAVVFFGPSGIGKSTVAKLSREAGYRVMASDQAYLRIDAQTGKLMASASPTRNPDIPRSPLDWVTGPLEVKALIALKRTGEFEVSKIENSEMARRFFCEVFRDETDTDFVPAFRFARDATMLNEVWQGALSYPKGFNFYSRLKELGYI